MSEHIAKLRESIRLDTALLRSNDALRRDLRAKIGELYEEYKTIQSRREWLISCATRAGVPTKDLAADAELGEKRVRQIAPRRPAAADDASEQALVGGTGDAPDDCQHDLISRPRDGGSGFMVKWPGDDATTTTVTDLSPDAPMPVVDARRARIQTPRDLGGMWECVSRAIILCDGDEKAAVQLLEHEAIPHAMALLNASRKGGRYEWTAHPALPEPLVRPEKGMADEIWEGRPAYRNPAPEPVPHPQGSVYPVYALDTNAAYLAALRRVHLPIGRLVHTPQAADAPLNPRLAGIYLIQPAPWKHADLPNPLGDGRDEKGPVWVTDPTLRLLLRVSDRMGLTKPPKILDAYLSRSSESLLGSWAEMLIKARGEALDSDSTVMYAYVKALYSRFVSTCGDSSYNRDLWRPEWMHAIHSQAYANLWLKAHTARRDGLTVVKMTGTDELHVAGPWMNVFGPGTDVPGKLKLKSVYGLATDEKEGEGD